jgi:hypothetical protein
MRAPTFAEAPVGKAGHTVSSEALAKEEGKELRAQGGTMRNTNPCNSARNSVKLRGKEDNK